MANPAPEYANFNILCLDGGGVRGALSSVILSRIMEIFPALIRDTDLIVGTSTGGIQALELSNGMRPHQLLELYTKGAKHVFADSIMDDVQDLWRLRGADYGSENLRQLLELEFGPMTMAELSRPVAIVAFNLDNGLTESSKRTWKPKIFHNIERNDDADLSAKVVDVAMATSAAPIYFPTAGKYADGGLVANNPSVIGLSQALDRRGPNSERNNVKVDRIKLLSLGTGKNARYIKGSNLDWGLADWGPYIMDIILNGAGDVADFQCRQFLGNRYHRINPALPEPVALDEWSAVPDLVRFAQSVDLTTTMAWLEDNWR